LKASEPKRNPHHASARSNLKSKLAFLIEGGLPGLTRANQL
jgi:hypothetical protein